jgi:hypothetical protein
MQIKDDSLIHEYNKNCRNQVACVPTFVKWKLIYREVTPICLHFNSFDSSAKNYNYPYYTKHLAMYHWHG